MIEHDKPVSGRKPATSSVVNHQESNCLKQPQHKAWLVTAVLVLLLIATSVQAAQSYQVLQKVKQQSGSAAPTGSGAPAPASLQGLPDMVGGC